MDEKLNQLTSLTAELVPTDDRLAIKVDVLSETTIKSTTERSKLRLSNVKLSKAIEPLVTYGDKLNDLDRCFKLPEEKIW